MQEFHTCLTGQAWTLRKVKTHSIFFISFYDTHFKICSDYLEIVLNKWIRGDSLYFLEIHRNREFYRTQDVRPPFTYASLIRQVSSHLNFHVTYLKITLSYTCTIIKKLRERLVNAFLTTIIKRKLYYEQRKLCYIL